MGTAAEFMITPYGSLIVGFLSGIISTFGYLFVTVSVRSFVLQEEEEEEEGWQGRVKTAA